MCFGSFLVRGGAVRANVAVLVGSKMCMVQNIGFYMVIVGKQNFENKNFVVIVSLGKIYL